MAEDHPLLRARFVSMASIHGVFTALGVALVFVERFALVGILLCFAASLATIWIYWSPVQAALQTGRWNVPRTRSATELLLAGFCAVGSPVLIICLYLGHTEANPGFGPALDEVLPGVGSGTTMAIPDSSRDGRKYNWALSTPEGAKASFYQTASNNFAFSVTDIHGETYTVDIPLGSDGIPIGKTIYLFCEVGSASNHAYLRVLVNGREVGRKDLKFPVAFGSRKWLPALGGDGNGENGGSMVFMEMVVVATTLPDEKLRAMADNALKYWNGPSQ